MERIWRMSIPPEAEGVLLRGYLRERLALSSALLARLKQSERGILLNGRRATVRAVLHAGDVLELELERADSASPNIIPAEGELDIVYEDEDLLILNKPARIPVHPSQGHYGDSLANIAVYHYARRGQNFVFRPVNRLDRGTSGLMAVAKNAYCHERLIASLHTGLRREYLAIACGRFAQRTGVIDAPIARAPGSVLRREVSPSGDPARTHYEVLAERGAFTLLRLRLETGRTHQIRVHLAHMGHPLVGDFLYGEENRALIDRTALHAAALSLTQPITGRALAFRAPLPADMLRLWRACDKERLAAHTV
ncbi:RluA family pseudouridine synthase [Feifania hominis]|uniref:Pseudouridine synthase n=1 Tax=Feifania hominis TaxID=2763660 RepID=A0A926DE27_9FIRM|nr:RluA family pseudouridine synthase [Feifania hominis]MBC8536506.1 RluA family pseudouridine synthase [Feifania hominis]